MAFIFIDMATNGWGKAHTNNTIGFGQGSNNNTIGWGNVYADSYSGDTDLESEGSSFDPDYQAVLDYATTQGYALPSTGQQTLQNQLVVALKAKGVWSKLDSFNVFATDGGANFALIDWVRLLTITAVNSPIFTANEGFKGVPTAYLDTNFNPSTQGVNFTANNASAGVWMFTKAGGVSLIGYSGDPNLQVRAASSSSQRINSSGLSTDLRNTGLCILNKTSSGNQSGFNNLTEYTGTTANRSVANQNILIHNRQGSIGGNTVSVSMFGASLATENTDLYNALNDYITAI